MRLGKESEQHPSKGKICGKMGEKPSWGCQTTQVQRGGRGGPQQTDLKLMLRKLW